MINRDIYNKAPQDNRLVNNGVAEVSEDHSEAAQSILRYELETFVCDGQYEKGLESILDKFLMNLNSKTEQPGVWVSGFYGSVPSGPTTRSAMALLQEALPSCPKAWWRI
jgi:hypothetical protein